MAMARYRSDASPSCRPWQDCAPMRSRRGLGQEKRQFVAIYRRHVFGFSLFWQDMRAMYPESPAKRRWGMHRANILPPRGVFAVRSTRIMHGARILLSSDGLVPAPAPRQYPPPANACRLPCPLQSETSRRWTSVAIIRRMACSSGKPRGAVNCVISTGRPTTGCCAELGLNSKAVSKWAQNRRRSPQARPVLRQRCRKRPSKGRIPLDGTIGTPKKATKVVFLGCPWPSLCQSFSRLRRSVSQHRCRVGLSWAALVQFVPGSFEIY